MRAIRQRIGAILQKAQDSEGRVIGSCKTGVYAFYDFDGEPIYVGQTREGLRTRIRRHLTNQRTDAVAMNVLDPFEVAEIEMWPLWNMAHLPGSGLKEMLDRLEYTVFQKLLAESSFNAILNEKAPPSMELLELPASHRERILSPEIHDARSHPDIRIARRAGTIAALAKVISERRVSPGLRRTLLTQTRRLERLAMDRLTELGLPSAFEGTDDHLDADTGKESDG